MDIDKLQSRWNQFERKSFPLGHRTKMIGSRNLTVFSSEIGGLILSFINSDGMLGGRQSMVVEEIAKSRNTVEAELESADARQYFAELFDMLQEVAFATDTGRN